MGVFVKIARVFSGRLRCVGVGFLCAVIRVVPENSVCVGSGSYCAVFGPVFCGWFVLASVAGFQCCGCGVPVCLVCSRWRTGSHVLPFVCGPCEAWSVAVLHGAHIFLCFFLFFLWAFLSVFCGDAVGRVCGCLCGGLQKYFLKKSRVCRATGPQTTPAMG